MGKTDFRKLRDLGDWLAPLCAGQESFNTVVDAKGTQVFRWYHDGSLREGGYISLEFPAYGKINIHAHEVDLDLSITNDRSFAELAEAISTMSADKVVRVVKRHLRHLYLEVDAEKRRAAEKRKKIAELRSKMKQIQEED